MFDFHQIEQVILNLLNNAEQAIASTGKPGPRRRPLVRDRTTWVGVEIEDDGPGIPPGVRHRIFDPFFTTKERRNGDRARTLRLVRDRPGASGPHRAAPRPAGRRRELVVTLPRAIGRRGRGVRPRASPSPRRPLAGRRVLVAEDEPLVLDLFSRLLEQDGATVTRARDGEEAWSRILETDFDLIVADLRMPNLDGRALYERVVEEKPSMMRRFVFATGDLVRQESLKFLEDCPTVFSRSPWTSTTCVASWSRPSPASERCRGGGSTVTRRTPRGRRPRCVWTPSTR